MCEAQSAKQAGVHSQLVASVSLLSAKALDWVHRSFYLGAAADSTTEVGHIKLFLQCHCSACLGTLRAAVLQLERQHPAVQVLHTPRLDNPAGL